MAKCCGGDGADWIRETVRDEYGKIAQERGTCCGPAAACGGAAEAASLARGIGYSDEELSAIPAAANLGLSCGNPTALASLRPGEVVLDLGSGAGFDVFIAANKVGPTGQVIGVDMTPEMVSRARRNADLFRERTGLNNVEFRLGEIEHLPVADASVDVVISNCVINLSPHKQQVWREIARVLRPGGRVAVSDLALLRPLPEAVRESVTALVGCIAGAVLVEKTDAMIRASGLADIVLEKDGAAIDAMTTWNDPLYREVVAHLAEGTRPSDLVTSLRVTARKPAGGCGGPA